MTAHHLSSSMTATLDSDVQVTAVPVGRERKMAACHEDMKVVLRSLQKYELEEFVIKKRKQAKRKRIALRVLHRNDVSKA